MKTVLQILALALFAFTFTACTETDPQITSAADAGTTAMAKGENGATTFEIYVPEELIYNPCCDEWMSFSGTLRGVIRESEDGNGGYHFLWNEHTSNWTGIGLTTGTEYVPNASYPESFRASSKNPGAVYTFIVRERAIGKGGNCTIIINYHMKATVNANGELVVSIEKLTVSCPTSNGASS